VEVTFSFSMAAAVRFFMEMPRATTDEHRAWQEMKPGRGEKVPVRLDMDLDV
jgi:hypothetical protein